MENTKVTLNDLEAYVSKLEAFVQKLDSDRRSFTKYTFDASQKILKAEAANR
jgi:hypothetical protein